MNDLRWINKPKIPAIYECPKCGKDIGFIGRMVYAREIYGRKSYNGYYAFDSKIHRCMITRDYKKELEKEQ